MKIILSIPWMLALSCCTGTPAASVMPPAAVWAPTEGATFDDALDQWLAFAEAKGGALTPQDARPLLRLMAERRCAGAQVPMDDGGLMDVLETLNEHALALRVYAQHSKEALAEFDRISQAAQEAGWKLMADQQSVLRRLCYWDGRFEGQSSLRADILSREKEWSDGSAPDVFLAELANDHASGRMDAHDLETAFRFALALELPKPGKDPNDKVAELRRTTPDPRPLMRRLVDAGRARDAEALRAKWNAWYPFWEKDSDNPSFTVQDQLERRVALGGDLAAKGLAQIRKDPWAALGWTVALAKCGHWQEARQFWAGHVKIEDTTGYWENRGVVFLMTGNPEGPWQNQVHERLALEDPLWIGDFTFSARVRKAWLGGDRYCGERFLAVLPKLAKVTTEQANRHGWNDCARLLDELRAWQLAFLAHGNPAEVRQIQKAVGDWQSSHGLDPALWPQQARALLRDESAKEGYSWKQNFDALVADPVPGVDPAAFIKSVDATYFSNFQAQALDEQKEAMGIPMGRADRVTRRALGAVLDKRDWTAYWRRSAHYAFTDLAEYGTGDRCMQPDDEQGKRWAMMLGRMKPGDLVAFLESDLMKDHPEEVRWDDALDWGAKKQPSFPLVLIREFPQMRRRINDWRFSRLRARLGWTKIPQGKVVVIPRGVGDGE